MGRRERRQLGQAHLLGAADCGDGLHGFGGVDAILRARDELVGQTEIDDELGDRGHETGDPRRRPGTGMGAAGSVDEGRCGHKWARHGRAI